MSCKHCGTRTPLWCLGCERVQYCGASCQETDWTHGGHSEICGEQQQALVGEGTLVHMIRRAPDRFDQNLFWSYLRARRPTADEFVMDLADEEGIDETNRKEWNRVRDKILDWVFDEQSRDNHGKETGIFAWTVIAAVTKHDFLPLAKRIMLRRDFKPLFYRVALSIAAENGSVRVLQLVLNLDTRANMDNLSIYYAAKHGHAEVLRILLRDGRFDPKVRGGRSIVTAAKRGHTDAVRVLLADPRVDPTVDYNHALRWAAENNYPDVVRVLLADPRVDPTENDHEAVRSAVMGNHLEVLRLLLDHPQVDPSYGDNEAIQTLAQTPEAVQMLLAHPRIRLAQRVLYNLVEWKNTNTTAIVKVLLEDGRIDPSAKGNRVLESAVTHGRDDIVELLLKDGRADPSFENGKPLVLASILDHPMVVRVLLSDPRVDPRASGHAAFKLAVRRNKPQIVREFLRDGRVNPFKNAENLSYLIATGNSAYHVMLRLFLADPRVRGIFSKENAQELLDNSPEMPPEFRRVLEDYIRDIQRGGPVHDDEGEPPAKMIKDFYRNF